MPIPLRGVAGAGVVFLAVWAVVTIRLREQPLNVMHIRVACDSHKGVLTYERRLRDSNGSLVRWLILLSVPTATWCVADVGLYWMSEVGPNLKSFTLLCEHSHSKEEQENGGAGCWLREKENIQYCHELVPANELQCPLVCHGPHLSLEEAHVVDKKMEVRRLAAQEFFNREADSDTNNPNLRTSSLSASPF